MFRRSIPCRFHTIAIAAFAAMAASGILTTPGAYAQQALAAVSFSITSTDLPQALAAFEKQAGVKLTVAPGLAEGRVSRAVQGRFTVDAALNEILAGTGLTRDLRIADRIVISEVQTVAVNSRHVAMPDIGGLTATTLQDTPKTVSVIDRATMDELQAQSIEDITKLDAAVRPSSPYGFIGQEFNIRGIDISAYSYLRDGLPVRWAMEPIDQVDSVEILKGVSALQYGASTSPGGAVNFVPKMPTALALTSVTSSLDSHGSVYELLDVSRRFDDGRGGLRVNIARDDQRFAEGSQTGDRTLLFLAADYRLTPETTLSVNGYVSQDGRDNYDGAYFNLQDDGNGKLSLPRISYDKWYGQDWAYDHKYTAVIEPRLVTEFGDGWKLTLQAHSYWLRYKTQSAYLNDNYEADGSYTNYTDSNQQATDHILAARIQLQKDMQWVGMTHHVSLLLDRAGNHQTNGDNSLEVDTPGNFYNGFDVPDAHLAFVPRQLDDLYINQGVTLDDRIELNGSWTADLGFRENRAYQSADTDFVAGQPPQPVYSKFSGSPAAAIVYKPTRRVTTYVAFSEAIEPSGNAPLTANGEAVHNANQALPPANDKQIEAGVKAELSDSLLATVSVFNLKRPNALVNADQYYVLDGMEHYKGIELGLSGDPISRLHVVAGATFINGTIDDSIVPAQNGGVPVDSAKFAGSVFAQYDIGDGFAANGGVYHVGSRPLFQDNSLSIPAYTTVDLGGSIQRQFDAHKVTVTLGVFNLANKFYWASSSYGSPAIGQPRTFRLTGKFDY